MSVGNEFILDAITPSSDLTTTVAQTAIKTLLADVQSVNTTIKGMDLAKHLPMGTSDAGSAFNVQIAEGIDYFMANGWWMRGRVIIWYIANCNFILPST